MLARIHMGAGCQSVTIAETNVCKAIQQDTTRLIYRIICRKRTKWHERHYCVRIGVNPGLGLLRLRVEPVRDVLSSELQNGLDEQT